MDRDAANSLTETERQCLRLFWQHRRVAEVAQARGGSVNTVNNHLKSARAKLGVSDSLTAARMLAAIENVGVQAPTPMPGNSSLPEAPAPDSQPIQHPGQTVASHDVAIPQQLAARHPASHPAAGIAEPQGRQIRIGASARLAIIAGLAVALIYGVVLLLVGGQVITGFAAVPASPSHLPQPH